MRCSFGFSKGIMIRFFQLAGTNRFLKIGLSNCNRENRFDSLRLASISLWIPSGPTARLLSFEALVLLLASWSQCLSMAGGETKFVNG